MENTNWLKQTRDKPLFPDLLWSRPENKRYAGKLMIIGGHAQQFNVPSEAYSAALKAGIGTARVLLPDSLRKVLGKVFLEAEFAPSTPIGSFSRQALDSFLDLADWADGVLLSGDFGKNSETAILLESFIDKYTGQLTLAGDAVNYFLTDSAGLTARAKTLVVASLAQIQKLAGPKVLIQQRADLINVVKQLSEWTSKTQLSLVTEHSGQIIAASAGQVSTTPAKDVNLTNLAAYATVWWLQQPEEPFEALSSAVYSYGL